PKATLAKGYSRGSKTGRALGPGPHSRKRGRTLKRLAITRQRDRDDRGTRSARSALLVDRRPTGIGDDQQPLAVICDLGWVNERRAFDQLVKSDAVALNRETD